MRKTLIALFLLAGCTDAGDAQIEIPFDLLASDQLSSSSTGVCTVTPVTQAGGVYKASGMLEVSPVLNPNAQYELNLQVENDLSEEDLVDSSGNTLATDNDNDFHAEKAVIKYIDIEGNLSGLADNAGVNAPSDVSLVSATVRPGGIQAATAVPVLALSTNEIVPIVDSFQTSTNLGPGAIEDLVLEVQLFGTLGSGEVVSSGLFHFPIELCFGCEGLPMKQVDAGFSQPFIADCSSNTAPIAVGHGPCCAPQDFYLACLPCGGGMGAVCCGQVANDGFGEGSPNCGGTLSCSGAAPQGVEICNGTIPSRFLEAATCGTTS